MQVVYQRCCGLDIHKKLIVRVRCASAHKESKKRCAHSARRWVSCTACVPGWSPTSARWWPWSPTGVDWKAIWNVLEEELALLLVNAQHMKAVPGRKTDQKDAEWIAELLQYGLLRASLVPPRPQRELREVTR